MHCFKLFDELAHIVAPKVHTLTETGTILVETAGSVWKLCFHSCQKQICFYETFPYHQMVLMHKAVLRQIENCVMVGQASLRLSPSTCLIRTRIRSIGQNKYASFSQFVLPGFELLHNLLHRYIITKQFMYM